MKRAMKSWRVRALSGVLALSSATTVRADDDRGADIMRTAYLRVDYGLTTYKSEALEQNDTGTMLNYGVGVNVGETENFGILIRQDASTVAFELNDSSLTSSWQDTCLRYRWGWLYLGAILGQSEITGTQDGSEVMNATGSGYGGNVGFVLPIRGRSHVYLDVASVTISKIVEAEQREVTFGPRMDIDLGASVELTKKLMDLYFGYRRRTHAITIGGEGGAELHTSTYLGLQFGSDF